MLTSKQLALRWSLADNTLRKWRVAGIGPDYVKLGIGPCAEVRYMMKSIEEFEQEGMVPTARKKKRDMESNA